MPRILSVILGVIYSLLLFSCEDSGSEFKGLWVSPSKTILITDAGNNNYVVTIKNSNINLEHLDKDVPARYMSESSTLKFKYRTTELEAIYQNDKERERIVITNLGSFYKK